MIVSDDSFWNKVITEHAGKFTERGLSAFKTRNKVTVITPSCQRSSRVLLLLVKSEDIQQLEDTTCFHAQNKWLKEGEKDILSSTRDEFYLENAHTMSTFNSQTHQDMARKELFRAICGHQTYNMKCHPLELA